MAPQSLGTEVTTGSVYFADTGEKIDSWDSNGRLLVRDVVVHVSGPTMLQRLDALEAEMSRMKTEMSRMMSRMKTEMSPMIEDLHAEFSFLLAQSNAFRVRNVAAQIMLAADGEEFRTTTCTRFKARGVSDKGVMDTAEALGLTPAQFINKADMVVTRRNKQVQFSDLDELEEAVAEVTPIITPALKVIAKWECAVVLNYATIKAAFPDGFKKQE